LSLRPSGFIALPGGERTGFDHADTYVDRFGSRVYVAHTQTNAVDIIDCRSNTYLRSISDLAGVAGVLIDSERDLLFTSDRAASRVSVFRCSDETLVARIAVGARPNGLAFDTKRGHLYSFNLGEPPGANCTASVISVDERRVIQTIGLPGRPRWAVFDPSSATLLAADLLFVERVPSLDGRLKGWQSALTSLKTVAASRAVPGHGPVSVNWPSGARDLDRYLDVLLRETRAAVKRGMELSDAVASVGMSERGKWKLFDDYQGHNVTQAFKEVEWE